MAAGITAAGWAAIGTTAVGAYSASQNAGAAGGDSDTQNVLALYGGMIQQQNLINQQQLMAPFVNAGISATEQERELLGTLGGDRQQAAVAAIQQSPQFQAMLREGENSILANGSATGGLRGGNVQAALAKFSPMLLASTINDRLNQLRGVSAAGQNAGLGLGTMASNAGNTQAQILQSLGQASQRNTQMQMGANNQMANSIAGGLGMWGGLGDRAYTNSGPPSGYSSWSSYNYGNNGGGGSDGLSGLINLNQGWGTI